MIKISVDLGPVQKRLAEIHKKLKNTRPLMREIADILWDSTMENFQQGGRPKWVPSAAALKRKGQTLIAKGRLMRSVHKAYGNNYAMAGTNEVYAAIHQFGGFIRRRQVAATSDFRKFDGRPTKLNSYAVGEIVARPYFKLQPDELKDIENTAAKYLGDKK
ncbi:MAG: phage virion morphogenesis protein [Elusimicrobia bacterium]|nr:phage virion morphogenesis protein [Elusimicrobiota bacterium]